MLTTKQSKLVKLAEEASEVAKEALKAVHFPGREYNGRTPEQSLREEILDLLVCVRICERLGIFAPITDADVIEQWRKKTPKIEKYTQIAVDLGTLAEYWVPQP